MPKLYPPWSFIFIAFIICFFFYGIFSLFKEKDKTKVVFVLPANQDSSIYFIQKNAGWGIYQFKSAAGKYKLGDVVDVFSIQVKKDAGYLEYDVEK